MIREMTLADYEKVYALWMSSRNMGFNDKDDSREGIARFLKRNPGCSFVAEDAGALLGVILTGHDGRRGYVYHLCVHEDWRGRGIGSRLVSASLDALRAEGISKVALLVFKRNAAGSAFWERQGFTARTDVDYRNRALIELVRIDT